MPSTYRFYISQLESHWNRTVVVVAIITVGLSLHYLLYRLYDNNRSLSTGVDLSLEMIDHGFAATHGIMDDQNEFILVSLEKEAERDLSRYQPLVDAAKEVRQISRDFTDYMNDVRNDLLEEARSKSKKNSSDKDTRYFPKAAARTLLVNKERENEVMQRINHARRTLMAVVSTLKGAEGTNITDESLAELEKEIPLGIVDGACKNNRRSQAGNTLSQMPLAAVLPLLSKFQHEMKTSEALVIRYLRLQIGGCYWIVDHFTPIASSRKDYVFAGEPFEAEITIGASSSSLYRTMEVKVDGQSVEVEDGIARYTARPKSEGMKTYNVDITIDNPESGQRETYSRTFEYVVGRRGS